jgi:superfamily I DNA/RNA helicase
MDAIELARQRAAELHGQAVTNGHDPWQPYDFALAEAKRRGLDVETAAPGAAMLNGGRATFIAADRLILHEKAGTAFERAFLIAHEIGHVELGDDPDDVARSSIDPARSAEPSPIGIDRVVDYGRRQRREIQMDLFAREFLFPRYVARKLHVQDNLTASAIADRLGAPFEVVAQQLFDALLLPEMIAEPEIQKAERLPNDRQSEAAAHRGKPYLLEAGPGTGKTQTLVARIEGLIADGVDPRRILVLTFSNKAAGELSDRVALKNKVAAAAMWIGTFHAFGLDVVRRFHVELGLPADPRMMDRTEAAELLEQAFPRLGLVHYQNLYDPTQVIVDMLAAISRAKDEVVNETEYAALAEKMRSHPATGENTEAVEKALEVAKVYKAYEELKRNANSIDFGDLVAMPVRLLEDSEAVRAHFQEQYDHVLVDEYQDVNRSSVRLLAALRAGGVNLWAVGDAKQSIYRFRGASSFNMRRFGKDDFKDADRGQLENNYRSTTEVVEAFSSFANDMSGRPHAKLTPLRGPGGHQPELRTVDRAEQAVVALADTIEEMRSAGHRYRDQAVLCTGNEKLSKLAQDLERLGIPVLFLGSLFEREEVKDLLAFLSILLDRRAVGLIRAACWSDFQMSMDDVAGVIDHLRSDARPAGEWAKDIPAISTLSDEGRLSLAKLANALSGFESGSFPWTVLATLLLDRTRMAANISMSADVRNRTRGIAIWQLMNFVRVQPSGQGMPIVRLLNRIRRLLRLGDDRDLRQLPAAAQGLDAVRLMTIHGSKGLEFPVVHIPGLNADTLPRTQPALPCPPPDGMVEGADGASLDVLRAAQAEEQECLFYVALSRARDRLFIYAPTQKANGSNRPLSPFLDRLGPSLRRQHYTPSRVLPDAPESAPISLAVDGVLSFTGHQLSLYESCARRFFYTHILQIGGRRTATPFMQMHDAVRTLYQAVVAGDSPIAGTAELDTKVTDALAAAGLSNGYAPEYRKFASTMVHFFLSIREGHTPEPPTALSLTFGTEQIIVRPDDVLVGPTGTRKVRRIQTGHYRSSESKDVGAAAFIMAARQAFPDATVELVHLSDQSVQELTLSDRILLNQGKKIQGFLADIRRGQFPPDPSPRTCPGCPAFFVCGPTPPGVLKKKF